MTEKEPNHQPLEPAADREPTEASEVQSPELEELRAKEADFEDRLLRVRAELENLRKRSARDVEDARKYALQGFVHELLPVKDSLEKGLEAAATDATEEADGLRQGIGLTLKLWREVLAREGVEEIDPSGQPFNPDFHEALSIGHSVDVPPNTVLEVIQKGYLLNGRLVRPARVIVAGGGDGAGSRAPASDVDTEFE